MSLTNLILEGNRLALARLLTQVENDAPEGRAALADLFPERNGVEDLVAGRFASVVER